MPKITRTKFFWRVDKEQSIFVPMIPDVSAEMPKNTALEV
jgi:hypothetical protein